MTYDLNTDAVKAISDEFANALTFIAEQKVYISFKEPYLISDIAGVKRYEIKGEYSCGEILGHIEYVLVKTPDEYQVARIFLTMGDSGKSDIRFDNERSIYNGILNKHKLYVTNSMSKPVRMERISLLCDQLEGVSCSLAAHAEILKITKQIRDNLGY